MINLSFFPKFGIHDDQFIILPQVRDTWWSIYHFAPGSGYMMINLSFCPRFGIHDDQLIILPQVRDTWWSIYHSAPGSEYMMINLSFYHRCENYTYIPLIDALNIYHLSDICQDVSWILINPVYWKSEPVQSLGILARTGFHRLVCTN